MFFVVIFLCCCFTRSLHWPFVLQFGASVTTLHARSYVEHVASECAVCWRLGASAVSQAASDENSNIWGSDARASPIGLGKGTNRVSTNGVFANYMFSGRGTFWVLPLTCSIFPGRTLFLNLSEFVTSAASPSVLAPLVRNRGLSREPRGRDVPIIAMPVFHDPLVTHPSRAAAGSGTRRVIARAVPCALAAPGNAQRRCRMHAEFVVRAPSAAVVKHIETYKNIQLNKTTTQHEHINKHKQLNSKYKQETGAWRQVPLFSQEACLRGG